MSEIEVMKRKIESMKGAFINQLQDEMDKRGSYSIEKNTMMIIDARASKKKQIMEEIVREIELITSKVT